MEEFYVVTNSFAAPFFRDTDYQYVKANDAEHALSKARKAYKHPCGLYSAGVWKSADDEKSGEKPLAKYLSDKAKKDCG